MASKVQGNSPNAVDVANAIRTAILPMFDADEARVGKSDELKAAKEDERGVRAKMLLTMASMSDQNGWSQAAVDAAVQLIRANKTAGNTEAKLPSSINTFMDEIKLVAGPAVRAVVPSLIELVSLAWESETEALKEDKGSPRPLRDAFSRQYQAGLSVIRAYRDGGYKFRDVDAIVDYAIELDPSKDADKIEKELVKMCERLAAIGTNFDHVDVKNASNALKIAASDLREVATFKIKAKSKKRGAAKQASAATTEAETASQEELLEAAG